MIITHDDFVKNVTDVDLIDIFDNEFPSGFDFSNITYILSESAIDLVILCAEIFKYTGLFSSITDTLRGSIQMNFVNGYLENPSKHKPAFVVYDTNSKLLDVVEFYTKGKRNNLSKYKPAVIRYDENGIYSGRMFLDNGEFNDPLPNIPAIWLFGAFKIFYSHGQKNDPPNGEAAASYYNMYGSRLFEHHYKNGVKQ